MKSNIKISGNTFVANFLFTEYTDCGWSGIYDKGEQFEIRGVVNRDMSIDIELDTDPRDGKFYGDMYTILDGIILQEWAKQSKEAAEKRFLERWAMAH